MEETLDGVVPEEPIAVEEEQVSIEAPAPQTYKLPDGREVDPDTLYKEYAENLLPEFTRRSQELAELKKQTPQQEEVKPWQDPNWVPQTYAEIAQVAKMEALQEMQANQSREQELYNSVMSETDKQIEEIKKIDPNINVDKLFVHANKYQFSDLKLAHENMREVGAIAKATESQATKNITKRSSDPVSAGSGNVPVDNGADVNMLRQNFGAKDLLSMFGGK